jgi:hypothetical protein
LRKRVSETVLLNNERGKIGRLLRKRLLATALVAAVGLGAFLVCRPRSLEDVARTLVECQVAGDADCLYRHLRPEERRAAGFTRENFQQYLNLLLTDNLKGAERDGGIVSEQAGYTGSAELKLVRPNKERTFITGVTAHGDDGVIAPNLPVVILWSSCFLEWPPEKPWPSGKDKLRFLAPCIERKAASLEAIGIKGLLLLGSGPKPDRYLTWKEIVEEYRNRGESR